MLALKTASILGCSSGFIVAPTLLLEQVVLGPVLAEVFCPPELVGGSLGTSSFETLTLKNPVELLEQAGFQAHCLGDK